MHADTCEQSHSPSTRTEAVIEQNARVKYLAIAIRVFAVHVHELQEVLGLSMEFPEHSDNVPHILATDKHGYDRSAQESARLHARVG